VDGRAASSSINQKLAIAVRAVFSVPVVKQVLVRSRKGGEWAQIHTTHFTCPVSAQNGVGIRLPSSVLLLVLFDEPTVLLAREVLARPASGAVSADRLGAGAVGRQIKIQELARERNDDHAARRRRRRSPPLVRVPRSHAVTVALPAKALVLPLLADPCPVTADPSLRLTSSLNRAAVTTGFRLVHRRPAPCPASRTVSGDLLDDLAIRDTRPAGDWLAATDRHGLPPSSPGSPRSGTPGETRAGTGRALDPDARLTIKVGVQVASRRTERGISV
jgi:hypothetical protein